MKRILGSYSLVGESETKQFIGINTGISRRPDRSKIPHKDKIKYHKYGILSIILAQNVENF
jgi:hypothetical protein